MEVAAGRSMLSAIVVSKDDMLNGKLSAAAATRRIAEQK
jgi:hypothetical protein